MRSSSLLARPTVARLLTTMSATTLPGDVKVTEHFLSVPLDHSKPDGGSLSLFVRELVAASKATDDLPCLLYLQGGPGFPSKRPAFPPAGWDKAALAKYLLQLTAASASDRKSKSERSA